MIRMRTSASRTRVLLVTNLLAAMALAAGLFFSESAVVQDSHAVPAAQVSFTFDDGFRSSLYRAAPTLRKHGLTGTSYVITDCVGMVTTPHSCRARPDGKYMTWEELRTLRDKYGWEIGSHGVTHQCLASSGGGCQEHNLTPDGMEAQLVDSQAALAAHGITATAFAPPYGDYDQGVIAKVAQHYSSMRGFADVGINMWPYNDYLIVNIPVREGVDTVSTLRAKVDDAISAGAWVVFTFHDIVDRPSSDPNAYQFGSRELDALASYVRAKVRAGQIRNVNVSQGLISGITNRMPNASFNSGIGEGWWTDAPNAITADAGGNGSHPDPVRSVRLVSGAAPAHLHSPRVTVVPGNNYLYKVFLNVSELADGGVGFYVDEYDSGGTWVSGQYRKRENWRWVEELNFAYTPSSADVAGASLQVILEGTDITAYLDNVEMVSLGPEPLPRSAS